jgi:hypothetical protein
LAVVADPHVSIDRDEPAAWHNPFRLADSAERLAAALAHPLVADVDLVTILGDLAHFGDAASIDCVSALAAATARPMVLVAGNHDVLVEGVRPVAAAPLPCPPAGLGVRVHDVTALTTRQVQPFDVAARRLIAGPAGDLVLTHFPLLSLEGEARDAGLLYAAHLDQLAPAPPDDPAPAGRPTVVLSGHLHLRGCTSAGDVLQLVFAALVEPPYDVAAVDITVHDDGSVTCGYACASVREPEDVRLPVLAPAAGTWRWGPGSGWSARH